MQALIVNCELQSGSRDWLVQDAEYSYAYSFDWLGRSVLQSAQDIVAIRNIIWKVKPDVIIATGASHEVL